MFPATATVPKTLIEARRVADGEDAVELIVSTEWLAADMWTVFGYDKIFSYTNFFSV